MSNLAVLNDRSVSLGEKMELCKIMARSSFVPNTFKGKPEDVFLAVSFGSALGFSPLQALQCICIINGKVCVYGDGLIALCSSKDDFEFIKEDFNEETMTASCTIKMKDKPEHTVLFSWKDAQKAGLTERNKVYQQYPKRMLTMRARGFAIRDRCAHHLMGLITREEAEDYPAGKTFDHQPACVPQEHELLSSEQEREIVNYMLEISISEERKKKMLDHYKVDGISSLSAKQAEQVIKILEAEITKALQMQGLANMEEQDQVSKYEDLS